MKRGRKPGRLKVADHVYDNMIGTVRWIKIHGGMYIPVRIKEIYTSWTHIRCRITPEVGIGEGGVDIKKLLTDEEVRKCQSNQ